MVSQWVLAERRTHSYISEQLKRMFPSRKGFSVRSVQRFCSLHNIHSTSRLSEADVDKVVKEEGNLGLVHFHWDEVTCLSFLGM